MPDRGDAVVGHRARPFVCGALGPADPVLLDRLTAAAPAAVRPEVVEPGLTVLASAPLDGWSHGGHRGWSWGGTRGTTTPASWWGAARDRGAAGVAVGPAGPLLHTDQLGLHDVYVRRLGDTIWFSTRIDPLLRLTDAPVRPDLAAWATCLVFGAPVGGQTTVAEVRRVRCGSVWQTGSDAVVREVAGRRFWDEVAERAPSPAEMAELLAASLPAHSPPMVVTLSGGWDSRVLASLAVRRRLPVEAWTTYQHRPGERDLQLSVPVAAALGLQQHVVLPRARDWPDHLATVRARTEHQTWLHGWLQPLAVALHALGRPVLDGLYGDALLRADRAARAARTPLPWAEAVLETSGTGRLDTIDPRHRAWMRDAAHAAVADELTGVADHPNAWTVAQLVTRQNRAVAQSPMLVFGPEIEVAMPFTAPEVVSAALAVPLTEKDGNGWYQQLLRHTCGPEGALPSTNDPAGRGVKRADRATGAPVLRALAGPVATSPLAQSLLRPDLRERVLRRTRLAELGQRRRETAGLAWAALLADFEASHPGRLDWSHWPA